MNKRGTVVLRDVMFMMIIVSSIFVLAGFFIEDLASNYENSNMSSEWASSGINVSGSAIFDETNDNITSVGEDLAEKPTGVWALISSAANALEGLGNGIMMVITAPTTLGKLLGSALEGAGAPHAVAVTVQFIIQSILWIIVIFSIFTAFSRGSKL